MSIYGSCDCKNIEIVWHIADQELVPRACQCEYCRSKSAAYVSRPNTRFDAIIHNRELHRQVQHGSNSASFHECSNCEQVVFVTAEIDGDVYGALNAKQFVGQSAVSTPVAMNFSTQSGEEKRQRWRQNWCRPVLIKASLSDKR